MTLKMKKIISIEHFHLDCFSNQMKKKNQFDFLIPAALNKKKKALNIFPKIILKFNHKPVDCQFFLEKSSVLERLKHNIHSINHKWTF